MYRLNFIILFVFTTWVGAQETDAGFSLTEYLAFVKQNHPVISQADLKLSEAEARILKARGGFDPKVDVNYNSKQFKDTEYYDLLYGSFKIPTWFGIELQAGYEQNTGVFLNPERTVPEDGLYSAGISIPIGQGLFINERMATLKQAKIFTDLNAAERELQINQLLYRALLAYMNWHRTHREYELYTQFLENASIRLNNLKRQVEQGDKAPIDSVELGITVRNREINLQDARINLFKARLELSNFLWTPEGIPLEVDPAVVPDRESRETLIDLVEQHRATMENFQVEEHPKIRSLEYKIATLEIDRKLKAEMLKPELNLNYNFITSDATYLNTINSGDYKFGLEFSLPLFLRKERGDLKLSKFKIQDANFEYRQQGLELRNKVSAALALLDNYRLQQEQAARVAEDYRILLQAEERKFSFGESSVFLLNSRESSLLQARLKQIALEFKLAGAYAEAARIMALPL